MMVNVSGSVIDDYVETAAMINELDNIPGIELNISCPNVKEGGMAFGTSCPSASAVVEAVRKVYKKHLMVKLSPNVTDITEIAKAVEAAGADSVSLINTLLGMAINAKTRKPVLSTITGGLSGPAVKPIALRMVYQVAQAIKVPIVGLGGIMNATDAIVITSYSIHYTKLYDTCMRSEGMTVFMEPKALYNAPKAATPIPDDFEVPFGKARIRRQGDDLTIITYGNTTHMCLEVAEHLNQEEGVNIEVIDLRSLLLV